VTALAQELADLLILILGTDIAANLDLKSAFGGKMNELMQRQSRMVDGRIRVSTFRDSDGEARHCSLSSLG